MLRIGIIFWGLVLEGNRWGEFVVCELGFENGEGECECVFVWGLD